MRDLGGDGAVMVAADDALHLLVARDHFGERGGVAQPDPVHMGDAAGERRVVHADEGRLAGHLRQGAVEPLQLFGAQLAVAGAGHQRVQHDQPHREVLHGVLHVDRVGGDVGQVGEAFAQLLAPVVIAGDDEQRHRREATADQLARGWRIRCRGRTRSGRR